jgi:hypothetical protein
MCANVDWIQLALVNTLVNSHVILKAGSFLSS